MTKVCYTCRLEKPFEDFYADKTRKDGRGGLCKLCIDTYLQKYRKTDKYKEMHGRNQRKYEKSHPLVVRAHNRTFERKLNKYYCENCHSIINLQFHHPDYSEPDNVIVLCIKCHTSLHTKKRNEDL